MSSTFLILAFASMCLASAATGTLAAGDLSVRSGGICRVVGLQNGHLVTRELRAGPTSVSMSGPEYRICVGEQPQVLSSTDYLARAQSAGVFRCEGPAGAPVVEVAYSADAKQRVVRKKLTITNAGHAPVLLRWVDAESGQIAEPVTYAVRSDFPQLGDWGQPVYTRHFFFGIEFPAARCTAVPDGSLQMREYPGVWLQPGQSWSSHPAVVGGSAEGAVKCAFMDYVAAISPHAPRAPRPFIYWNGFRVIKPPDRTTQGLAMVERARELKQLTGFTFDSWTYDAGFDMYRPDALWAPMEPDIWPKTRQALHDVGTPLGFWTSFSCIFDTPTHAWGAKQGYGLQHASAYCLAEPEYAHAMEERLSEIVRTYGMRSINFDGMYWGQGFGCNTPGHGHLVGAGSEAGVYGTYAVVENAMRIFRRLRREQPDICLDLFICNEWSSPWWLNVLDGVHTVAGDTVAAGIPSPWLRDELITVRDMQVWDEHRRLRRQFPLWAEDLYGSQVRADHLIDDITVTGEDMAARWEDEFVMALAGRGAIQNQIVCSDLNVLARSRSGLRFLGEVGNWVRKNAPLYRHWALIGGEPARQESFGYVHGDGKGRALVALRNPSIRTQEFQLQVGPEFNLGKKGPYQVTMVYPYRYAWPEADTERPAAIQLGAFEVALLEVRAASRRIAGVPESKPVEAVPEPLTVRMSVPDTSKPELVGEVASPGLDARGPSTLQIRVNPPPNTKSVAAKVEIDGTEAPTQVHFRDRGATQDAWILVDLPPHATRLRIVLDCPLPARVEAWLDTAERPGIQLTGREAAGLFPELPGGEFHRTSVALASTLIDSRPQSAERRLDGVPARP